MKRWIAGAGALGLLLALNGPLGAQEMQVSWDAAGQVEVIDARLARRAGIFLSDYPGFREARLFQASDTVYVLEVTTDRDGRLVRERVELSVEEADALRSRVSTQLAANAPEALHNHEGRYLLLGQSLALGLGVYSWAVPVALGVEDGSAGLGMGLMSAGASFFVPFLLTSDAPVTYGMANLSRYGASRGILHGAMLYAALAPQDCVEDEFGRYCDYGSGRGMVGTMLATSMAEGVAGYLWARNENMTAGTAATIAGGGDLGMLWGGGTAVVIGGEAITERVAAGAALVGSYAGMALGRRFAAGRDFTWGDAGIVGTAGWLGLYTSASLAATAGMEDARLGVATALLGSGLGVYLGDRLVSDRDFTVGQATLNQLGTVAGGLTGLGLAAVGEAGGTETLLMTSLGALIGYGITYQMLQGEASLQRGERYSSVRLRMAPEGLARAAGAKVSDEVATPLFSVEYRF